jgi:hypothetical protein
MLNEAGQLGNSCCRRSVHYSWQMVERLLFGVKTCSDYQRNLEPISFLALCYIRKKAEEEILKQPLASIGYLCSIAVHCGLNCRIKFSELMD